MRFSAAEFLMVENQIAILRALQDLATDNTGVDVDFKRRAAALHARIEAAPGNARGR